MDFSVKQIKELLSKAGLPVDALDKAAEEICSRHNTTLDAIKEERDNYKKDAETLVSVQKELNDLKNAKDDGYKEKYEKEHQDFEKYKQELKNKETAAKIRIEYRKLLDEKKINSADADLIMAATNFNDIQLDSSDKLVNIDKLKEDIKTKYNRYIPEEGIDGANVKTPPDGNANKDSANTRAAELAKQFHERRYGKTKTE